MGWLSQIFELLAKPFQWWVVVAPWESGIRVRLGRTAVVLCPGIHLRVPFLDRIYVQSVRLRMISDTGQTMTTRDGKVVTIAVAVQYAIADIRQLYLSVSTPESTLLHRVQGLAAQVVSQTPSTELSPMLIEQKVSKEMSSAEWGLDQVQVWITSYAFVRTYRLLMNDYRSCTSLNDLDYQTGERGKVSR